MKKLYVEPWSEVIVFNADVITASKPNEEWGEDSFGGDFD